MKKYIAEELYEMPAKELSKILKRLVKQYGWKAGDLAEVYGYKNAISMRNSSKYKRGAIQRSAILMLQLGHEKKQQ